jgi:hypothetical protein
MNDDSQSNGPNEPRPDQDQPKPKNRGLPKVTYTYDAVGFLVKITPATPDSASTED